MGKEPFDKALYRGIRLDKPGCAADDTVSRRKTVKGCFSGIKGEEGGSRPGRIQSVQQAVYKSGFPADNGIQGVSKGKFDCRCVFRFHVELRA